MIAVRSYVAVVEDAVALSDVSGLSLADAGEIVSTGIALTATDVVKVAAFREAADRLDAAWREVI